MVGLTGFEPAASSSRTRRATKLRHSPPLLHQAISVRKPADWATRASIPERERAAEIALNDLEGRDLRPSQEAAVFRVKVRWVTPLGEETASIA